MKKFEILCCPSCRGKLRQGSRQLMCASCRGRYPIINGIVMFHRDPTGDITSEEKWNSFYQSDSLTKPSEEIAAVMKQHIEDAVGQIEEVKRMKDTIFMEIGCGTFALGARLAKSARLVVGIDLSPEALSLAKKRLDSHKIKNYLLVQGDIRLMPVKSSAVDFVYGGGVIEHFPDTQSCVDEIYRVLKKGGVSFNSVPMLNIGSLTYRQRWGSIPNIPLIREIWEFINVRFLEARHMTFGFEMAFLRSTLYNIHKKAGFTKVIVDKYNVLLVFELVPKFMRKALIRIANSSPLFWPMIKAVATK